MKKGDSAVLRVGLVNGARYGGILYIDEMYFDGHQPIIRRMDSEACVIFHDHKEWVYSTEMFETINSVENKTEPFPYEIRISELEQENKKLRKELTLLFCFRFN